MTAKDIQDLYQNNEDFKTFIDKWADKLKVTKTEVINFAISRLYAEQLLEKEDTNNEEIHYEIRQDNGI